MLFVRLSFHHNNSDFFPCLCWFKVAFWFFCFFCFCFFLVPWALVNWLGYMNHKWLSCPLVSSWILPKGGTSRRQEGRRKMTPVYFPGFLPPCCVAGGWLHPSMMAHGSGQGSLTRQLLSLGSECHFSLPFRPEVTNVSNQFLWFSLLLMTSTT